MTAKKPWTVMVYLAADNNLSNFGVDSLRQMKAVTNRSINVVAEFDTGPMNRNKRYAFEGDGSPYGPLDENLVESLQPKDPTDPNNLAAFIKWGASEYPAEHYFVVIWGHGAGVDDDFPRAPDNSFVPRHHLLSLFKGVVDAPLKGVVDAPLKGVVDAPLKGVIDAVLKGVVDAPLKTVLDSRFKGLLSTPLSESLTVLSDAIEGLRPAVIEALKKGISTALDAEALNAFQTKSRDARFQDAAQAGLLRKLQDDLFTYLEDDINDNGRLTVLRQRVLGALLRGFFDALQTGVLCQLQKDVLQALHHGNGNGNGNGSPKKAVVYDKAVAKRIHDEVGKVILRSLENGILEALQSGTLGFANGEIASKALAFVDHPASYLTNAKLREVLADAAKAIGKIDLFGMDACNMNMVEIGYDLRDSVRYMVASQDNIPDASWPYDRILAQLVKTPEISPAGLARLTSEAYINGYKDYFNQQVTLSVLDLSLADSILPLVKTLAAALNETLSDLEGRQVINRVRDQTRSFGGDQFVDLIHFCQLLTGASGSPKLARAASDFISGFQPFIGCNQFSATESNCNGTSIYFPRYDPQLAVHEMRLGKIYRELTFSQRTKWGDFVSKFLQCAADEEQTAISLETPLSHGQPEHARELTRNKQTNGHGSWPESSRHGISAA
ncbi:MAG TPA: clostripain-related cysteine peptidase [Candidatus Saccharimonadales bacterium]|jgi:hypothetical protein|nr:clostripain-related cysteine peptidase [Candidatus Saccharimonadales bacterium]